MADPINPPITEITKSASLVYDYTKDNEKIPTLYAVNQLFSGQSIGNTSDINSLTACGVFKFGSRLRNMPDAITTGGILVVYNERLSKTTVDGHAAVLGGTTSANFGYSNKSYIRQIIWPDGPDNITPYTRTRINNNWTEWQTLGGNLRRVQLTANLTSETNPAQTNVMYYSFGNHTLFLPNPNTYPLGTRIGLEQYMGRGTVKWNASTSTVYTQITEPAYRADENTGLPTSTIIGPNVYYFEIVEENASGTRTWLLDVDNDLSQTVTSIRADISTETAARINADSAEATARSAKDAELQNRIETEETTRASQVNNKERLTKSYYVNTNIITSTNFADGNNVAKSVTELLKNVNPIFVLGSGVSSVALPAAGVNYNGAKVTIEITAAKTVTITAGNDSESFTNDTGATLVLPFECVMTGTSTYAWNLLVIA